jgi:hypothetical protein
MKLPSEFAQEIARLMRDPDALRHERLGRRGHYDPNQPRVPAGHSDGGQWTRAGGGTQVHALSSDEIDREIARLMRKKWKKNMCAMAPKIRSASMCSRDLVTESSACTTSKPETVRLNARE